MHAHLVWKGEVVSLALHDWPACACLPNCLLCCRSRQRRSSPLETLDVTVRTP